ncbi:MAG: chemotaxis protein CheW [Synechococcales bacterium]|nr:chemotaxis protein CheW [Synechococcales bacterium]
MPSLEEKSIIALARQGNAEAIALMLNYYFNNYQIHTTVSWMGDDLSILLQGPQAPNRAKVVAPIQYVLKKLNLANLNQICIYGQQRGQAQFVWQETIPYRAGTSLAIAPPALNTWLNQGLETPVGSPVSNVSQVAESEQRLLRFDLGNQQVALIPLNQIQEVVQVTPLDILPVPQMPGCVIGVCNHRGRVLWLVDCNQQLGLPSALLEQRPDALTVVVVQQETSRLGLVISRVIGIETYSEDQILPPDGERFSPRLQPFLGGCLAHSTSPILSVAALVQDRQLQVH